MARDESDAMALPRSSAIAITFALIGQGCSPSAREPESSIGSVTSVDATASPIVMSASAAVSASERASAEALPAPSASVSASVGGASSAAPLVEVEAARCELPPTRPPGTTVRFMRHQLPIHAPPSDEGIEVHAEVACPAADGPRASLPALPCKAVTSKVLDDLYGIIRKAGFQRWRHRERAGSPHYGARTIEIVLPNRLCRFSDSTETPIAADAEKAFRVSVDAIIGI